MNDIRMTSDLAAPVSRVWKYLTERGKIAEWLMESDIVAKIGNRFRFTSAPSGTWDSTVESEMKELIACRRLSYTWNANDIAAETLVTFELEEAGDGTRMTLSHTGFERAMPGARGRHAAGWTDALTALRTALCGPDPDYDWSAFQITFFIEAPLPDLYSSWATAAGLRRFWADEVVCTDPSGSVRPPEETFRPGDRIALKFPTGRSTELEIINIEKEKFVAFTFGENYGWVRVAFAEGGGRTRIVLRQFGLPTGGEAPWEVHANARGWWIFNLMNLKSTLLFGRDLRVRDAVVSNGLGALYLPGDETARPPHGWTRFDVCLYIEASPREVLARWHNARGIESFFVGEARFTDESGREKSPEAKIDAGDTYDWRGIHGFRMQGRIAEATARRVAFTFGSRYFVEVTVTPHGAGTLLRLHQSGMADDPDDRVAGSLNCRSCWIYFLTTLKSQLEFGIDLRDRNRQTADAISVGYNR